MKKYLVSLTFAIMCIFVLAISVGATEYTVSSNDEYQAAFENAVNGDIIIINGELTCDIQATKSITYVLKANWQSACLIINQGNVEVSFLADGGDYKIIPTSYSTTNGWLNLADAYENVVINLAGINDGTVTIDGTNATHDTISYATQSADLTWNFFSGSAIANFNPTTGSSSEYVSIIYANTFNMYDGSKIYANNIINAPLIKAVNFNLFGGEIFGNYLTSDRIKTNSTPRVGAGAIYVTNQFLMYGGKIYNNIFNTQKTTGNVRGFISVPAGNTIVVLGGELGNNYTKSTGSDDISAIFGVDEKNDSVTSYFYYNSNMTPGTRYFFTETPELSNDEATGKTIWQVSGVTKNKENWYGYCWKHTQGSSDKIAIFLDGEKKLLNGVAFYSYAPIDAFITGIDAYANNATTASQKNYTYSYSGATELTIPESSQLWSTLGTEYCHDGKAYTLDDITAAMPIVLYKAYDAGIEIVNGTTMCAAGCGKVYSCNNPDHNFEIDITYESYLLNGAKTIKCLDCGYQVQENSPLPLFTCLGYSVPEDGRGGIAIGFTVNNDAIAEYTTATGKTLKFGAFAVLKDRLGDKDIFSEDGATADGVISVELSGYEFTAFSLRITGFTDEQKDIKLAMGAYVSVSDGETTEYSYLQSGTPNDGENYCFVSYNDVVAPAPKDEEEVVQ